MGVEILIVLGGYGGESRTGRGLSSLKRRRPKEVVLRFPLGYRFRSGGLDPWSGPEDSSQSGPRSSDLVFTRGESARVVRIVVEEILVGHPISVS